MQISMQKKKKLDRSRLSESFSPDKQEASGFNFGKSGLLDAAGMKEAAMTNVTGKKYQQNLDALFGPTQEKIKQLANKQVQKMIVKETKKTLKETNKVQEKKTKTDKPARLFDFEQDFSSSDYEEITED